jgi:hypothetical protein
LKISANQKQELPMVALFFAGSRINEKSLLRISQTPLLSCKLFGLVVSIHFFLFQLKQEFPLVAGVQRTNTKRGIHIHLL